MTVTPPIQNPPAALVMSDIYLQAAVNPLMPPSHLNFLFGWLVAQLLAMPAAPCGYQDSAAGGSEPRGILGAPVTLGLICNTALSGMCLHSVSGCLWAKKGRLLSEKFGGSLCLEGAVIECFLGGPHPHMWMLLGQASNPHCSCCLQHSWGNTGSLTCCATRELP